MITQTINTVTQFRNTFVEMERENQFSHDAFKALFNYFDEFENFELDVIAICCDFTEYKNLDEVKENYSNINSLEDLRNMTTVLELDNGGLVIANY